MGSPSPLLIPHLHLHKKKPLLHRIPLLIILILLFFTIQFLLLPSLLPQNTHPASTALSNSLHQRLAIDLQKCTTLHAPPVQHPLPTSSTSRENPRWNAINGQTNDVVLQNATLFDGESWLPAVDVRFSKGIVLSVSPTTPTPQEINTKNKNENENTTIIPLHGKFLTPGLIDLHSHHLVLAWPDMPPSSDVNEIHRTTSGPLTPFARSLDGMKVSDVALRLIASGGITSSLILPGSANVMGGEAYVVKNAVTPLGVTQPEERVEELLLEKGVDEGARRRYMKMACGENPKRVYGHTRMGNAWVFRKHMDRARELVERQDEWCLAAEAAREGGDEGGIRALFGNGGLPEELELESSVAILRGKVGVNVHCYEPEDFEDMIRHSKEFGFRIQAFHHALSAWKVPEMIKESEENITIATFATHGLYKKEAYEANLWAGKILSDHGVPVAYKSDHSDESMNAQYLLYQAATAHSFHLPEHLALQSLTSVPAKSLGLEHRIGFVRPGYDADLVVFDSHPLSIGATPLQVYIDGKPTLNEDDVRKSLEHVLPESLQEKPSMRPRPDAAVREETCRRVKKEKTVITGITRSYLQDESSDELASSSSTPGNLTLVLENGKILCFSTPENCISHSSDSTFTLSLQNGHVLPGLTAAVTSLGLSEIDMEDSTGDGKINADLDPLDPESVVYAKYGVHLDGRAFARARVGGVTRVVSAPLGGGFLGGVSVGIKTSGEKTVIDGGIVAEEVALHFTLGQGVKRSQSTPTISSAVAKLRKILSENDGKDNIYGRASNGSLPLVVHADNKDAILQLIKIKSSFPAINLVIYGASEVSTIPAHLIPSSIPIILLPRPAASSFQTVHTPPSPPLSPTILSSLLSSNESFVPPPIALGSPGDAALHSLALEASWAGKLAGLGKAETLALVSKNVERILGLPASDEVVVWEGEPGEFGAAVVLVLDGEGREGVEDGKCWPESE